MLHNIIKKIVIQEVHPNNKQYFYTEQNINSMATKSHKCTDKFMTPGNTMEVVQARRYFF
ncbi:hypothetical protein HMPREF1060_02356 [Parabacteroides merdae CL03T12C32]|uniref:Uncharacterized protein n=1 Tax=Parabacteroides merdae CL03T12C32 TaxID=999420 RepID=K5ZJG5_9BACT|nr:hypothetical protein HMPREF1060_02356 [Parabacteroides merdae CL03T12C32]